MPVQTERRLRLPPDARSAGRARRMVADALATPELADLDPDIADVAVLLASELAENAVLHAGTEFAVELTVDADEVGVAVTDRGPGALEMHLARPRRGYGRAATHGRGLEMVQRLATTWGTRHHADGRHTTWFSLARVEHPPDPAPPAPPDAERVHTGADHVRRLLHLPPALLDRLEPDELVAELMRRLRDLLDAAAVVVELDEGDGSGPREVARDGTPGAVGAREVLALPVTPPLRGSLTVVARPGPPVLDAARAGELTELVAGRVAMALETRWLREVDHRRRAWMAYLAETSELLGQSLDVELAVAVVPQVVVPRLGHWCAVHLADAAGGLRLAALTSADENELPELRAALDPDSRPGPQRALLTELLGLVRGDGSPVRVAVPTDGLAVPLRTRGRSIGTLLVGRPDGRPHSPEDVVMIGDIARRAALSVQNAQSTAAHVAVSQALQQSLLPRALPVVPGVEFAAEYLPATTGADVGGDFYDVMALDPTRWLVAMGDVCGKGARAAARTGLVRDVLRVLVRGGRPLPAALDLLNEVMMEAGDPLQYCTLAAALLSRPGPDEPPGLRVELVLAGHLQPVLVRADGGTELLGSFGTAVGLVRRVQVHCTTAHLAPGDALLAYTDGVTERRRGREQFGQNRLLAAAAAGVGKPARRLVSTVHEAVERFSPDPLSDDIALLAVRVVPGEGSSLRR